MIKHITKSLSFFASFSSSIPSILLKANTTGTLLSTSELAKLLDDDLQESNRYQSYTYLNQQLSLYVEKMTLEQQANELQMLLYKFSFYPKLTIDRNTLEKIYKIICRKIYSKPCRNLNYSLLFILKADTKAEQSLVFIEFLKFFLCLQSQVLKARYQINIRNQSLGEFIKQLTAKIVQKGFLSRNPPYTRTLSLLQPSRTLKLLMENQSTKQSIMIKKINFGLFMEIKEFYEQTMHNNLYHEKNTELWKKMNEQTESLFHYSDLTQNENEYLRELYLTLFLVLRQQEKPELEEFVPNLMLAYEYINNHIEKSEKVNKFFSQLEILVRSFPVNKYFCRIHNGIFILSEFCPQKKLECIQVVFDLISPLTFERHFHQIMKFKDEITQQKWNKLNQAPEYLSQLSLKQLEILTFVDNSQIKGKILNICLERNYQQILDDDLLNLLKIYQSTNHFPQSQTLRIFIFRFVSDHHKEFAFEKYEQMLKILIQLKDKRNFDDEEGHYPLSIYQQLMDYTLDKKESFQPEMGKFIEEFFELQ